MKNTTLLKLSTVVMIGLVVFLLLAPDYSFANTTSNATGGGLPFDDWIRKLTTSMTGPVAYALTMMGIIVSGGVLIFGGELNAFARTIMFVLLTMCMLAGSSQLYSFMGGTEISSVTQPQNTICNSGLIRQSTFINNINRKMV